MSESVSLIRGLLHNAAARHWAATRVEPETPSVDYRTGFSAGKEAGELSGMALALSALTGESVTDLIEEARAQAAVESSLPFELHMEVVAAEASEPEPVRESPAPPVVADEAEAEAMASAATRDLVPCPTCWLPADLLPPIHHDINHRSRCPRGHENTLVPAVLEHLRSIGGALDESA